MRKRLTLAEYLSAPGVSKHDLDLFAQCPAKLKAKLDGLLPSESSPAMQMGTAIHAAVLECRRDYVVRPSFYISEKDETKPWNGNAAACKAWIASQSGKIVLTEEQDRSIDAICSAVRFDKRASRLIATGEAEVSLFAKDKRTGLDLKSRLDFLTPDGDVIDVKTCADASTNALSLQIVRYRYHIQAAMNFRLLRLNGIEPRNWYVLAIETGGIPLLNVRRLSQASIAFAEAQLDEELAKVAACQATGIWPDYSGEGDEIGDVYLPDWAFKAETEIEFGGETINV